ncbi:NAD(P)-dependent glycerol-3-phosphate dehydrogenase [Acidiphilium sp. AL]|uniref:NAD(P)H-dependent glycerol-3-phosphate dehydrogenase n=1 Tax=Acidiphilium sp. AL TaxID=2871704 RepID=UPI0021CB2667|nr:NAD(P)H-dependent glycerol-3-phosphate dehydrogenase [Acidiphilium sp. AL]MCU4159628.1 NAD(P)-dependent glycerol-3-phosphate dehydrogenase [Acidiphilium sp. AL]
MSDRPDIAVIGTGAWGTALAVLYAGLGRRTVLVARDAARAEFLLRTRTNPRLPGVLLPESLMIGDVPPDAAITLLCPPFQHLRETLARLPQGDTPLVLCSKGVERKTGRLGPEITAESAPHRASALLTGPNFAHEIAAGLPAASVLATEDAALRRTLIEALATPKIRLYGSADIIGAALGGAAKNVIAIAAGTVIGAGLGENARAALITRGLAEIARLAMAIGGAAETVAGLAGLGDLILTATGGASRNYRAGLALGRGARAIDPDAGVIEGIATAPALLARARDAGCDMPVTGAVCDLLSGRATLADSMARLLRRDLKDETG